MTLITALFSPAPIITQLQAVSNAGQVSWWEGSLNTPGTAPVASTFEGVADFADLLFTDVAGNEAKLTVPAPVLALFKADEVTVDPVAAAALIAACIGSMTTNVGLAVATYLGGVRRRNTRDFP